MRAAPLVPHWPPASPSASMTSWSFQHMHTSASAPCARSMTLWQGWVSPVKTMLPVGVVVEVVVREEEVVHLRGPQAGFDELVRGRRATVEHGKPAAAEVEDV